jgi:hypothetical protein
MSKDKTPPGPETPPEKGMPAPVESPSFLRKHSGAPKGKPAEAKEENVPFPPLITHKELAQLWDVVIRAHYLAHELGDPCARSGLAAARMALALSEVLSSWATIFGEELEDLEKRSENEGGA